MKKEPGCHLHCIILAIYACQKDASRKSSVDLVTAVIWINFVELNWVRPQVDAPSAPNIIPFRPIVFWTNAANHDKFQGAPCEPLTNLLAMRVRQPSIFMDKFIFSQKQIKTTIQQGLNSDHLESTYSGYTMAQYLVIVNRDRYSRVMYHSTFPKLFRRYIMDKKGCKGPTLFRTQHRCYCHYYTCDIWICEGSFGVPLSHCHWSRTCGTLPPFFAHPHR